MNKQITFIISIPLWYKSKIFNPSILLSLLSIFKNYNILDYCLWSSNWPYYLPYAKFICIAKCTTHLYFQHSSLHFI